jgi:hypothetical protein
MSFVLMDMGCHHGAMPNTGRIPISQSSVVIRVATAVDVDDLRRLAALDSARALLGTVLVAESDGRIRAALSLDEGRAVADPFEPSGPLVELLRTRASLLRADRAEPAPGRDARVRLLPARP